MQMVKTINRYPAWWTLYYALRFIYFISIPVLSIFILFGVLSITSSRYVTQEDYIYTCVCLFLLIAPAILMYSRASSRKDKIKKIVAEIKNTGFYSPDKEYEGLSFWICPYISRHLLSLNPLQARCRRYSRGER